jgi:hypothetical protein
VDGTPTAGVGRDGSQSVVLDAGDGPAQRSVSLTVSDGTTAVTRQAR